MRYEWKTKLIEQRYTYVANRPCLIKNILIRVLGKRKEVRAKQKLLEGSLDPDDILQYAVYEGQQLAYKVTANSIYGALALRDYRLGASVTAEGRKMLNKVSHAAVHQFPLFLQQNCWTKKDVEIQIPDGPNGESLSPLYPTAVEGKPYCERLVPITVVGGDTGKFSHELTLIVLMKSPRFYFRPLSRFNNQ
ncbi:MAG: hypothetical protein EOP45_10070 [Sphingobacteriaceae bacterium]|nr:MAG: hypothetical protein EOP45_10070 [Sphingobacteriaceae bacterium]